MAIDSIRDYLRLAFRDWQLRNDWDHERDAHVFRLARHPAPIHLLTVPRALVEDNGPAQMIRLLASRGVAQALRAAPAHRVCLTTDPRKTVTSGR